MALNTEKRRKIDIEQCSQLSASFHLIPVEIVYKIFAHLSVHQLRCVIPLVCKRWKNIVEDPYAWKASVVRLSQFEPRYRCPSRGEFKILKFIESTPQLQHVHVVDSFSIHFLKAMLDLLDSHCKHLKSLVIDGPERFQDSQCSLSIVSECLTMSTCRSFPRVNTLVISSWSSRFEWRLANKGQDTHSHSCISNVLTFFPNLTTFKMSWTATLDLNPLNEVKDTLEELELNITEIDAKSLAGFNELPKLKRLHILESYPKLDKLLCIPAKKLTTLVIKESFFSPIFLPREIEAFFNSTVFTQLIAIKFGHSHLNDRGTLSIRKHCPVLESIEVEKAESAELTDLGLSHLLHLPLLRYIEIVFPPSKLDYHYCRTNFDTIHSCNPDEVCPSSADALLLMQSWEEHIVVI